MGGGNNRSLISAHYCISAYFLTAETYKRMRLTTLYAYNLDVLNVCLSLIHVYIYTHADSLVQYCTYALACAWVATRLECIILRNSSQDF